MAESLKVLVLEITECYIGILPFSYKTYSIPYALECLEINVMNPQLLITINA